VASPPFCGKMHGQNVLRLLIRSHLAPVLTRLARRVFRVEAFS
jgi:hypothetical protein